MWIVSVFKQGHSRAVTIPAALLRVRKWAPGSKVVWSVAKDGRLQLEGLQSAVQRSAGVGEKGGAK